METATWLPYLLGGGAVTGGIALLSWGRKDARDSVDAASSNTATAMMLRDHVVAENAKLKSELQALIIENARLVRIMQEAGIDPNGRKA